MWIVFALLAALLWGLNYSLAEKLLHSLSIFTLLALEMLLGAMVFSLLAGLGSFKKDWQTLSNEPNLLILTLIQVVVVSMASYLIALSVRAKNATAAGIIELIYPLFTIFFTWLLFRENHASSSVLIGGTLIFIGVLIISQG